MEKDIIVTTRNCFSNDQYMRQNNIEIDGIPNEISDPKQLENTVEEILRSINVNLYELEDCHRLRERRDTGVKTNIVRFVNRKACKAALKNRKMLPNININGLDSTKLFINENLNWYYKNIAAKCRRLKKHSLILDTWTTGGLVKIKFKNGKDMIINHQSDSSR